MRRDVEKGVFEFFSFFGTHGFGNIQKKMWLHWNLIDKCWQFQTELPWRKWEPREYSVEQTSRSYTKNKANLILSLKYQKFVSVQIAMRSDSMCKFL